MKYGIHHHDWGGRTDYLSKCARKRYEFAASLLHPSHRVLEVGCGSGTGTRVLREGGCDVLALDVNSRSEAGLLADGVRLPFKPHTFDAVTAFEVIEHMREADGLRMLSEIRRVLQPEGHAFLSTPNVRYALHPPYHVHEFRPEEFFTTVESVFPTVERYAQYVSPLDVALGTIRRRWGAVVHGLSRAGIVQRLEDIAPSSSQYYEVRPLDGPRALRIMVAVARRS